ncbi:hypothetical protein [Fusobacterium ulcerans]|uniref:hypothetical protein n=1 Tax=Fusobacterium ulcerans TaxID=861 RepID=UPI0010329944|nr:hypothetical protein [Fusobacterium ulcerans]
MVMNSLQAFIVLAIVYYAGEFIGTRTKAWIPSVFVTACLFLFGYWTFFPKNIVDIAGLGAPLGGLLAIMLCITHMGTIISIEQLKSQWKIICVTLAGLFGMVVFCWFICIPLIGRDYVIAGLPSLTGGIVAATMMNQAAAAKGLQVAAVLAIAMYAIQGFVGYPLTAIVLKKEGKILLERYHKGERGVLGNDGVDADTGNMTIKEETKKTLIPPMPEKYSTTAFILLKLMLVSYLSTVISGWTGGKLNAAVITLILGIVFTELGFLDKNSLQKSGSYGFLMYVLMIFVFSGLKDATPEMLLECIGPMFVIIVVGVIGMGILSVLVGKFLKVSWRMALATSLTALYGFPPNYILTEEAAKALAQTPEEKQFLMDNTLPQMIVGGFVTVTITSVIIAGIFVNLI